MNITVQYGIDAINKTYTTQPTVSQVIDSASVKAELGYGDNVRALINGVEQPGHALVPDGCTLMIEVRANQKAV